LNLCLCNIKKFCKALVGALIRFLITQKWTENEKDMRLRENNFFKKLETNYHSSSSCVSCVAPFNSDTQKTFVSLQFVHPTTQKSLNLIKV